MHARMVLRARLDATRIRRNGIAIRRGRATPGSRPHQASGRAPSRF